MGQRHGVSLLNFRRQGICFKVRMKREEKSSGDLSKSAVYIPGNGVHKEPGLGLKLGQKTQHSF